MITRVLGHERALLVAGVVAVSGLAWLDLWRRTRGVMAMAMPAMEPWSAAELGAMVAMWVVMMVAMMLPSAAPMLALFAGTTSGGSPAAVVTFAAGYVVVWAGFSVAAAVVQAAMQARMLLSGSLAMTETWLGAAILALAGVYQLTPLKHACLVRCRSPLGFMLGHWRDGIRGAFVMGVRHGAYCLGCCWALMALLFVVGVMNLAWVAALAAFVLVEKAVARGPWLSRVSGAALIAWAVWLAALGGA